MPETTTGSRRLRPSGILLPRHRLGQGTAAAAAPWPQLEAQELPERVGRGCRCRRRRWWYGCDGWLPATVVSGEEGPLGYMPMGGRGPVPDPRPGRPQPSFFLLRVSR